MNPFKILKKPEYLYQPEKILHRVRRLFLRPTGPVEVRVPWGDTLRVWPDEVIGSNIWCYGVFDLVVLEATCRLLDEGEWALDIGANIGLVTSLMRCVCGPEGKVFAFEPHPQLFEELREHVSRNSTLPGRAQCELYQLALSDREGEAFLFMNGGWQKNRGLGKVTTEIPEAHGGHVKVQLARLESLIPKNMRFGVCKIDVEGHELQVLRGAEHFLANGCIRDIIFEEKRPYPSPVHELLASYGYTIYGLHTTLHKPVIVRATEDLGRCAFGKTMDYLGTLDSARAERRFSGRGWKALKGSAGAWKK